jgi:hypothetical protein
MATVNPTPISAERDLAASVRPVLFYTDIEEFRYQ